MITFTATIRQFGSQGEKTGWTYIEVPANIAQRLLPGNKKSFRVKGKLDQYKIKGIALLPMGNGTFIMALNKDMRRGIGKRKGAKLQVQLAFDKDEFVFNKDFLECLDDDPAARTFFRSLTGSHQRYFSKWIDSAKTEPTRVKRITMAVNALARKWGYPQMLRAAQGGV